MARSPTCAGLLSAFQATGLGACSSEKKTMVAAVGPDGGTGGASGGGTGGASGSGTGGAAGSAGTVGASGSDGGIGEIVVYSTVDAQLRDEVEGYLRSKWGIQEARVTFPAVGCAGSESWVNACPALSSA